MDKEKLNLIDLAHAAKDGKIEIEIREGKALELLKPLEPIVKEPLKILGNIGTVSEFLQKRGSLFDPNKCNICVDLRVKCIVFNGNDQNDNGEFKTVVASKLNVTDDYCGIEINTDREFEALELARFLRKRKNMFVDSEQYVKVWSALSSFQAEVQRQITKSDDRTGNAANVIKQQVTSNLPKVFTLSLQVFENAPELIIDVEIDVEPNSLRCSMISFDLQEKIKTQALELIESELNTKISDDETVRDYCVTYYC